MRALFLAGAIPLAGCAISVAEAPAADPQLTHAVFFELNDDSDAAIEALVEACYEYLAPHDGIVHFSAGARHTDYQREVNDLDFDVALTIVFENAAAQDAYQVTEPHLQFIDQFNQNWASVRVFDSVAPATAE